MKKIIIYAVMAAVLLFTACTQQPQEQAQPEEMKAGGFQNIQDTAKKISSGEIDVGNKSGMELGERYHNIHADTLDLKCSTCHISGYNPDYIYQRKYKVPVRDAPGVVDRGVCLGCHSQNGPAMTKLYGTASD